MFKDEIVRSTLLQFFFFCYWKSLSLIVREAENHLVATIKYLLRVLRSLNIFLAPVFATLE